MLVVFTACTIMSADCREIVVPLADEVTAFQCALGGQSILAEWQSSHGAYRIEGGYKCTPPSRYARAI